LRIGVLTGGGDAPGLNAAIRAVVRRAESYGFEVLGIRYGWAGLVRMDTVKLSQSDVEGIVGLPGTVIKTSRVNPLKAPDGLQRIRESWEKIGLDALIAIGGDDTQSVALKLSDAGMRVVGVPKTIDNDLSGTDYTFGFDTAVNTAMNAIQSLAATGWSHDRIMVVEVMGRHAGWITLYAGLAAGADLILIPEEPFRVEDVVAFVERRREEGKGSLVIAVAEGALVAGYKGPLAKEAEVDQFGNIRLGGIGEFLAKEIEKATGFETRATVLGHTIRGSPPTAFDRVLATRLGVAAVDMVREGRFGVMVSLRGEKIVPVSLKEAIAKRKTVDKEHLDAAKTF